MRRQAPGIRLGIALGLVAGTAIAQQAEAPTDPALDNLVHEAGYKTAELGSLGAVVERGKGRIDMVLISGFGLGASAFQGFMQRNAKRYHMLAITLPGFEGTAAPPMPPAGTSYGDQTWTRAATNAVVRLIKERRLRRPVMVGHYLNGTQVAAQVAIDHPELVSGLVLLAGSPRYEPATASPNWPQGLTLEKKVPMVDKGLAPRWFKTVTRTTWVTNNFAATDFSIDEAHGKTFADRANAPPLPVLIRYLCEFHASDVAPALAHATVPMLLIQPLFTEALRSDEQRSYLASYFKQPWQGVFDNRASVKVSFLDNAGILVMDDKPRDVDRLISVFLKKSTRRQSEITVSGGTPPSTNQR
jgi:pimeloyl-ACP methyl ester carboxylesterase